MPVEDPVFALELDEVYRWKWLEIPVGLPDALPAIGPVLASERLEGQEVAASLGNTGDGRAAYLLDRDEPQAELARRGEAGFRVELVQIGQGLPGQASNPARDRGLLCGPGLAGRPDHAADGARHRRDYVVHEGLDDADHRLRHSLEVVHDAA